MKATKHMLSTVMDGVKDTNKLMDYAQAARESGDDASAAWFMTRAQGRMAELKKDKNEVFEKCGLMQKAKGGDDLAGTFVEHVDDEIEKLMRRVNGGMR